MNPVRMRPCAPEIKRSFATACVGGDKAMKRDQLWPRLPLGQDKPTVSNVQGDGRDLFAAKHPARPCLLSTLHLLVLINHEP